MGGRSLLAWNVRALRTARGLSQERLAIDAGIGRHRLIDLEREQGNTSVDLLDRLAAALDVSIAELFAVPASDSPAPQPLPSSRKSR